jgi:hypothetical protein
MKRETLINFMLTALLAAASANIGLLWTLSDRQSAQGERLARIETQLENLKARNIAKIQ